MWGFITMTMVWGCFTVTTLFEKIATRGLQIVISDVMPLGHS